MDWETLYRPKGLGGANLKSAREMNCAMMEKLAWRVLNHSGDVWSGVLWAKYGVMEDDGVQFRDKYRSSQIWKRVLWGAELMRRGLRWEVRNRKSVAFGRDVWLEQHPLSERLLGSMNED